MSRFEVEDLMLRLLDGLDHEQRERLDALLEGGDPDALAALAEAREALASLALGLDPAEPSRAVGERLMRRVRAAERSQRSGAAASAAGGPASSVRGSAAGRVRSPCACPGARLASPRPGAR